MDKIEKGLQTIFDRTEEWLSVVAQSKLRVNNLMAWLYKCGKKYEAKKEEAPDQQPEPKPEETAIKAFNIEKGLLLKFMKSEDSFSMKYLTDYLKPALLPRSNLNSLEFNLPPISRQTLTSSPASLANADAKSKSGAFA